MEEIKMTECGQLAEMLKEFEEDYVSVMIAKKDEFWHKRKGDFKDKEEQQKYDELNDKCIFLQNMISLTKQLISCIGVAGVIHEELIRTVHDMQIVDENANVRETLFKEQREALGSIIQKAISVYPYVIKMTNAN